MNDWLLISCLVAGSLGLLLAFVLGAFWLADRADDLMDYAERQLARGDAEIDGLFHSPPPIRDFENRFHTKGDSL